MSKETKIWSVGDGISIVYIENEELYIKVSEENNIERRQISEDEIVEALKVAHEAIKSLCELQKELLKNYK